MKYIVLIVSLFLSCFSLSQNDKSRKYLIEGNKSYLAASYDEAAANYLRAIQEGEDSYKSNFNLGNAMFRLKKFNDAVSQYQKSIKFAANKTEEANAHFNIGDSYYKKKDYAQAAESFKKALKLNPKDEEARYNYTLAKQKLKEQEEKQEQDKKDQPEEKPKDQQNPDKNPQDQQKNDSQSQQPQDSKQNSQQGQSGGKGDHQQGEGNEKNGTWRSIDNLKEVNSENLEDGKIQLYEEGTLGAIEEQERKTQQKIINKKIPPSQNSGGKDW